MENMLDEDTDESYNDWWTKYFASLEAAAEVREKLIHEEFHLLFSDTLNCKFYNYCSTKFSKTNYLRKGTVIDLIH